MSNDAKELARLVQDFIDANYPSWCLTHHTKRCNVEEARRLTEEARK